MYKLIEVKMLLTEPFSPIAAIMEQNINNINLLKNKE
jgi:hypothetical protein